jgi:hypothetical protein
MLAEHLVDQRAGAIAGSGVISIAPSLPQVPLPSPHRNGFECVASRLKNLVLHRASYTCWHER